MLSLTGGQKTILCPERLRHFQGVWWVLSRIPKWVDKVKLARDTAQKYDFFGHSPVVLKLFDDVNLSLFIKFCFTCKYARIIWLAAIYLQSSQTSWTSQPSQTFRSSADIVNIADTMENPAIMDIPGVVNIPDITVNILQCLFLDPERIIVEFNYGAQVDSKWTGSGQEVECERCTSAGRLHPAIFWANTYGLGATGIVIGIWKER